MPTVTVRPSCRLLRTRFSEASNIYTYGWTLNPLATVDNGPSHSNPLSAHEITSIQKGMVSFEIAKTEKPTKPAGVCLKDMGTTFAFDILRKQLNKWATNMQN